MIDELRAMAVFAKTVEMKSFRAAARELGLSPSVVSHHISQLEKRLNVALLYRSTRRISLTDQGRQLYSAAQAMLSAVENGLQQLSIAQGVVAGSLKLTLPNILSRHPLTDQLAAFAQAHPRVFLNISYSDHPMDLIHQGIDLAVRVGPLPDSGLKSRKLFDMQRKLVATADYLHTRQQSEAKRPDRPEDLAGWDWIGLTQRSNTKEFWHAHKGKVTIDFEPRISTDSVEAVYRLCCAGLGLGTPPGFMVEEALQRGLLQELIPAWAPTSLPVFAVWPGNIAPNNLTQSLVNFLIRQQQA